MIHFLKRTRIFSTNGLPLYSNTGARKKRILNTKKHSTIQPQKGPQCNPVNYNRVGLGSAFADCVLFILTCSDILSTLSVIATNIEV